MKLQECTPTPEILEVLSHPIETIERKLQTEKSDFRRTLLEYAPKDDEAIDQGPNLGGIQASKLADLHCERRFLEATLEYARAGWQHELPVYAA